VDNQEQTFQPSPPQGEPLQSHQSNKKILIYVLIGLIIAGGAFGYYIWQKGGLFPDLPTPTVAATPDPTADWQTYRNEQYGFEVRYPESIFNAVAFVENKDRKEVHFNSSSEVFPYPLMEIDIWEQSIYEDLLKKIYSVTKVSVGEIGGLEAFYLCYHLPPPGSGCKIDPHHVEITKGQQIFILSAFSVDGSSSLTFLRNDIPFNQILSTFRFIE